MAFTPATTAFGYLGEQADWYAGTLKQCGQKVVCRSTPSLGPASPSASAPERRPSGWGVPEH